MTIERSDAANSATIGLPSWMALREASRVSARIRGTRGRASRSAGDGARAATSNAPAASWATYDFVAATERSSPARQSITCAAAAARGDAASLTIATVTAPPARATSTTAMRSGDRPDCETAITRPPRQRRSAS